MKVRIPVFRLERGSGGIQRYVWEVSAGLARRGHHVSIHAPAGPGSPPPGVHLISAGGRSRDGGRRAILDSVLFGVRVAPSMVRLDTDEVRWGPTGNLVLPGVVSALSVHSAWVADRTANLGGPGPSSYDRVAMLIERRSVGWPSTRVTVISARSARLISETLDLPDDRLRVVAPAVDATEFAPAGAAERLAARERMGLRDNDFVVATVVNNHFEYKGLGDVLRAAASIGATVLVVGRDPLRRAHFERLSNELRVRSRFVERVKALRDVLAGADAFVLASWYETYGMAALEAMAMALTTVVTAESGIASMLDPGTHALVVGRRRPDELSSALTALRRTSVARPLAAAGRGWATSRTWDDVTDAIEEELAAYLDAARSRSASRSRRPWRASS